MIGINLKEPVYWGMTKYAHEVAKKAMESMANVILEAIDQGQDVDEFHGQALRDYDQFSQLVRGAFSFLERIGFPASGEAADLGSGTGTGASILSMFGQVGKVYAVEFSEFFVQKVMPLVFDKHRAESVKIQRVVGDFNKLDLEDGTLGIILDIDSFHHSEDLDVTLRECHRVMKPRGVIIAIDRAWPDSYTQERLEEMLDREFHDALKIKYNIPLEQHFTRRDFGEHEYTIRQWFAFFERNGFEPVVFRLWHPSALNRIWLKIPTFEFSVWFSSLLYKIGLRRLWLYGFATFRVMFVCTKRK